jgi:hypothetical protein
MKDNRVGIKAARITVIGVIVASIISGIFLIASNIISQNQVVETEINIEENNSKAFMLGYLILSSSINEKSDTITFRKELYRIKAYCEYFKITDSKIQSLESIRNDVMNISNYIGIQLLANYPESLKYFETAFNLIMERQQGNKIAFASISKELQFPVTIINEKINDMGNINNIKDYYNSKLHNIEEKGDNNVYKK